tara:strand:+ start:6473 stop:6616 length:144 start_codon:yes stop_codon:yes gene_type:complete
MMKNKIQRNIDTQFVYVKNEQVYVLKKITKNAIKEIPVTIDWIPAVI